jgi:hypothetical protein
MPIRINLLAEEQALEDMRRRDPVKRALFAGGALVVLFIGWIGITQISVNAARGELADAEARLDKVDNSSKQVKSNQFALAETELRLKSLEKYSTNRFFWASLLDGLQHAAVPEVRLMEVKAEQKYGAGDINKLFTTNVTVTPSERPPAWKFWAHSGPETPFLTLVSNTFDGITNKPPFTTNLFAYTPKITPVSTNPIAGFVTVRVDFQTPPWASERTVVEIKGRDYGNPAGAAIDELAKHIKTSPFFTNIIEPEQGLRFTERPPQARPDPQDPQNPNALFVPFTIELTLKEKVLTSE